MIAYEFYWHDELNGDQLIGLLPERRKNSERITRISIMNWVGQFLGNDLDTHNIFFVQVTIDKSTGEIF